MFFYNSTGIKALVDKDAFAKALAHYMFREIVEDFHSEGKITDEEMEQLNLEACNRAGLFGDYILKVEDLEKRGDIYCNVCRIYRDGRICF